MPGAGTLAQPADTTEHESIESCRLMTGGEDAATKKPCAPHFSAAIHSS